MPVRITKPRVNIREKLSELERPIGLNGSALMQTETPQEAFSLIGAGRRNLIINGGFDVWQRGTTGNVVGGPAYVSADRWKIYVNTSTTITLSRQTFTSGQTEVPGNPTYYGRFSWLGTVSAQFFGIEQLVEGVHHGAGDYLTISFYARTGNGENISLGINRNFGSGGSAGDTVGNYTLELETYWKKFVITVPVPSLSGKTIGAGNYISITWYRSGTVSTYLELSNVQVEQGKVATSFEYRGIGEELALCQRYFYKYGGSNEGYSNNGAVFPLHRSSNNVYFISGVHPVQMRGTPTLTTSLSSGTYATDLDPGSGQEWNFRDWYVDTRASGSIEIVPEYYGRNWTLKLGTTLSNANASVIFWHSSSTAFIYFNAEL